MTIAKHGVMGVKKPGSGCLLITQCLFEHQLDISNGYCCEGPKGNTGHCMMQYSLRINMQAIIPMIQSINTTNPPSQSGAASPGREQRLRITIFGRPPGTLAKSKCSMALFPACLWAFGNDLKYITNQHPLL
jgi:hypothetical protein